MAPKKTNRINMLKLSEEIVLLALNEDGTFAPSPEASLELAVTGAMLTDLALLKRIDTDNTYLKVADRSDTGDLALNEILQKIPSEQNLTIKKTLSACAESGRHFIELALESLAAKGILRRHEEKFLWVIDDSKYPVADSRPAAEARARIRRIVSNSSEIPSPRDAVIIALADCCNLLTPIFTPEELQKYRERINTISKMSFIAQEVCNTAADIRAAILEVMDFPRF